MSKTIRGITWENDSEVSHCRLCNEPFSFFVRKHHCRKCGYIFCSDCTYQKIPLPALGYYKEVRVCSPCFRSELDERRDRQLRGMRLGNEEESSKAPKFSDKSEQEELDKAKELISQQQKTIQLLMEQMKVDEDKGGLSYDSRRFYYGRSNSLPMQSHSLYPSLQKRLSGDHPSNPGKEEELAMDAPRGTVTLEFDEGIVNTLLEMGYSRDVVLVSLVALGASNEEITLESVLERLAQSNSGTDEEEGGEEMARMRLESTERKLKRQQEELKLREQMELQKESELQLLRQQIEELQRRKKEQEEQIEVLTGGFGYDTYVKIHQSENAQAECVICYDRPPNYRTCCGCKVMCYQCFITLKKKVCPSCGNKTG